MALLLIALRTGEIDTAWYYRLSYATAILTGLCTGLAGLLLLCRQRRVAVWFQWISTLAALIMSTIILSMNWQAIKHPLSTYDWILLGIFCAIPLWMAWFAWFLKRQESEE